VKINTHQNTQREPNSDFSDYVSDADSGFNRQ